MEIPITVSNSIEQLSPTLVRLTVEITPEALQPHVDEALKSISNSVNIPGFRRGKVPARLIEQRFGRAAVLEEALNKAIPGAYDAALLELEVSPVAQPNIKIEQDLAELGQDDVVVFAAEVEIRPEFELPTYKGLEVTVDAAEVSDADVQAELDNLRARFAKVTPVERAAADGDLVVVDVSGAIDGTEVAEFSGQGMTFEVGAGNMIDGFDDAVRGKSEGESAEFDFTPSDGEFADQVVAITVTVRGVRERELPEADDEFALLASEFDTIEELTADLQEKLARVKLVEQGIAARDKLTEMLLEAVEIPVPVGMLELMVEQHFNDGHGDAEHRDEFVKEAETSIRHQFLLDEIATAEDVTLEQDDLGRWIVQQAPRYNMSPDQFIQALIQADQLQAAYGDVRRGKAMALVVESAIITDSNGSPVDLKSLDEEDELEVVEEEILQDDSDDEATAEDEAENN